MLPLPAMENVDFDGLGFFRCGLYVEASETLPDAPVSPNVNSSLSSISPCSFIFSDTITQLVVRGSMRP